MDHMSYPLDPTDRRMAELQRRGLAAAEEMARTGGQLRYTRDRARNYARILAKAHKDGTAPPVWVLEEVGRLPDPTAETLTTDPAEASESASLRNQVENLRAERAELLEMLLCATVQGAPSHHKDPERLDDGCLSTWERILPELVDRGLAEGNIKDGYTLIWPEPTP